MLPVPVSLIEPALCHARAALERQAFSDARAAIASAHAALDLHRPPRYESYAPTSTLRDSLENTPDFVRESVWAELPERYGDPAQITRCVVAIVANAALYDDSALRMVTHCEGETPCVSLILDGPGMFPDVVTLGDMIEMPFEVFEARWTAATRGGRIDRTPEGVTLRFSGMRAVPESAAGLDGPLARLAEALAAIDAGASGKAMDAIDAILEIIDAEARLPEPTDLAALVKEVVADAGALLDAANLRIELLCGDALPPISVRRNACYAAVRNILRYALRAFPKGGGIVLLLEYEAPRRCAILSMACQGSERRQAGSHYLDSARRCLVRLHDGAWDCAEDAAGVTLTCTLPDAAGRALDAWMPHWERFSDRARQMLRLLRSGGHALPEAFVLEGVLEDELARWLLPRYESAAVVNMAHEMNALPSACPRPRPIASRRPSRISAVENRARKRRGLPTRQRLSGPLEPHIATARRLASIAATKKPCALYAPRFGVRPQIPGRPFASLPSSSCRKATAALSPNAHGHPKFAADQPKDIDSHPCRMFRKLLRGERREA